METLDTDILCYLQNNNLNIPQVRPNLDIDKSDLENIYHVNRSPNGHSSGEGIKQKYFGQLSKQLMRKFYERYKEDFLLHGYKIETFYSYASDIVSENKEPTLS